MNSDIAMPIVHHSSSVINPPTLALLLPCLNEQEVLPQTVDALLKLCDELTLRGQIGPDSHLLIVDDGSTDNTWAVVQQLHATHGSRVQGLRLSRNFGHQHALLAGIHHCKATIMISLDADGQDDPSAIIQMVEMYHEGYDIVYGVRNSRATDTAAKRVPAKSYYRMLRWFGVNIVYNHADFRLFSRRAADALLQYTEVNLFLRGLFPQLGFRTGTVVYARQRRAAGRSKYNLPKLLALGINGITSFSTAPLRFVTVLGIFTFLLSIGLSGYALYSYVNRQALPGWASTVLPIYFMGGVQLISIGIIGEYLAKIYQETKRRPRYIVEEVLE